MGDSDDEEEAAATPARGNAECCRKADIEAGSLSLASGGRGSWIGVFHVSVSCFVVQALV